MVSGILREIRADHGIREIPIFPELKPYLEDVFELAEPGDEFVITRYRKKNANLRTQLLRILKRAGIAPWPKYSTTCERRGKRN